MRALSLNDRVLGILLGLGDLADKPVCHGYANACICPDCLERAKAPLEPVQAPVQPWEPKRKAA